jgi:hypothetical protein
MLQHALFRLALILWVPALVSGVPALQESKEPPLVIYLESEGKKIPVEVDKPIELETKAGKTSLTLRMEPYRLFQYAGLYFQYPRGATFKTQTEGPMTLWTLSDSPTMVMVQHFKGASDPKSILKQMVDQMLAQYGNSADVKQAAASVELQKRPLQGVRLEVTIARQIIHQSLFSFASGKDTIVLILQDSPEEGGKSSRAYLQFQKMMRDSFRFPAK